MPAVKWLPVIIKENCCHQTWCQGEWIEGGYIWGDGNGKRAL